MHYLDVDRETRRARVLARNTQGPIAPAFPLTSERFDALESYYESPSDDELYEAMIVCESEAPGGAALW
jgi:hypothetical protein